MVNATFATKKKRRDMDKIITIMAETIGLLFVGALCGAIFAVCLLGGVG
jgi:ABC-type phosphate/phosphonate transport system permease subunit